MGVYIAYVFLPEIKLKLRPLSRGCPLSLLVAVYYVERVYHLGDVPPASGFVSGRSPLCSTFRALPESVPSPARMFHSKQRFFPESQVFAKPFGFISSEMADECFSHTRK